MMHNFLIVIPVLALLAGCLEAEQMAPASDPEMMTDPVGDPEQDSERSSGTPLPPRSGEPPMPVVETVVRNTPVPVPETCPLPSAVTARNAGKPIATMIDEWPAEFQDDIDILKRVQAGISIPEETAYARNCLGLTTL